MLEEFSVIVWIMKFYWLNYISVECEEYLKIGSRPLWLTEDRKLK